ncbi:TIGR01777 family oxidoreductase [Shewanella maritima]|uniref:TIGR01777 family oxidoreductase n=1 Tax=Shewanella maritima TaxID=2520507 RepID=UPI0037351E39
MKILITGATGFVGKALVNALTEQQLSIVSRNTNRAKQILGPQHDYLDSLLTLTHLNDFDAVINLAGEPIIGKRWSDKQKQVICDSRWSITAAISQLISQSDTPPHTFISASAVGFYGRQGVKILNETSPVNDEFSHRVCKEWERLALQSQSTHTRVCITRIGIVLGKNGGALAKMLLPFKLGAGGPIGSGNQGFSWIHINDLVGLIHFLLLNNNAKGVFNATAPQPVSNKVFSKALGRALNRPAIVPTPSFALKLAMGEMAELLTEGQYVYPQHAIDDGYTFQYSDIDTALSAIL